MGCARISMCLVIRKLLPGVVVRYTVLFFAGFNAIWTMSGVLAQAFPCKLPTPWRFTDPHECFDAMTFQNYVGISSIVLELLLVLLPLFFWNVRLSASRSVSVSLVFLARLRSVTILHPSKKVTDANRVLVLLLQSGRNFIS
jgi:hypothetical protein